MIRQLKGRRVAVIRYSGSLSEADMKVRTNELKDWLDQRGYKAISEPRLAGYDPPLHRRPLRKHLRLFL